jgi:hypothetical protein
LFFGFRDNFGAQKLHFIFFIFSHFFQNYCQRTHFDAMSGSSRSFTPDEKEMSGYGYNVSVTEMIHLTDLMGCVQR